jgi:hypothetical protein
MSYVDTEQKKRRRQLRYLALAREAVARARAERRDPWEVAMLVERHDRLAAEALDADG